MPTSSAVPTKGPLQCDFLAILKSLCAWIEAGDFKLHPRACVVASSSLVSSFDAETSSTTHGKQ